MKKLVCKRNVLLILGTASAAVLITLAIVLCLSMEWMFETWNNLSVDELMYHVTTPLEGTNEDLIEEYLNVCVAPAVLVLFGMIILFFAWKEKRKYFLLICKGLVIALIVSAISVYGAWNKLDMGNYVESQGSYSTFIDEYYVDPADVSIVFPEKKRNLIYIFLESMECTYADEESGGAFRKNVIPELTDIAQENQDFSGADTKLNGGYVMPGATWTIAGMFAQTAGIPLKITIDDNSMDTQDAFFPGVVTLGDILDEAGYSQTLLIGSDATFGGRRLYFTEHGNFDICDYTYALEEEMIPEDYRVWWGYEDQKLFEFAKGRLLELSKTGEPFNLTMLTVDTHFEDGYACQRCSEIFKNNQYANVMSCSSRQISRLIEWIQRQDFYANTTIVLSGDHLTMDSDFCEYVNDDYTRRTYTAYINPAAALETEQERNYTTFDQFATTLSALGVAIDGNRLGLGTNLFSNTPTLTERFGVDAVKKEIEKKSKLMEEYANLDEDKEELLVRQRGEQGEAPSAEVTVEPYEYMNGTLSVRAADFQNMQNDVEMVLMAVWTDEEQSDLQWIQMELQEDESYYGTVYIPSFGYKEGEYYIHVYAVDDIGEQYIIGSVIGIVN